MQLGLSTYSFPWNVGIFDSMPAHPMHYSELIAYTANHQIRHLQFGDNMPLDKMKDKELEEIKQLCSKHQINIQTGTRRLSVDNTKRYLDIAQYLQSPFLRMVIDDADYHPEVSVVIDIIKEILPVLYEKNIVLAIENHDRFHAKTLEHIILSTSKEYVGICLDTANSLGAGEGINEILPVLLPYTVNLHIKDFNIERVPHKMGFTVYGTAAGEGMLNIPELINTCSMQPTCKTATLEIWMNEEKDVEQAAIKEKQWTTNSIHYLKKFIQ